jgi:hypothetical protein
MTPQPDPTAEDMADFATPVADMPPPPPQRQSKGLSFDFNGLIGRLQTEGFDSLSLPQKELLWHLKDNPDLQMSPEQMAMFVTETDKRLREQSMPEAQARVEKTKSDAALSKIKLKQAEDEIAKSRLDRRDVILQAQSMLDAAKKIDEAVNSNLVGPWKDVEQKFDGSGLPFSDPDEYTKRKALEVQTKKSIIDSVSAFKGPLSDSDRLFFTEMYPVINEPVGVWMNYKAELERKFKPIAEGNFDLPSQQSGANAAPAAQPAPQAAPAPPQFRSKEEVIQATNSGQLSREQAAGILRAQFGNQFR